jgi:hypothetical protein
MSRLSAEKVDRLRTYRRWRRDDLSPPVVTKIGGVATVPCAQCQETNICSGVAPEEEPRPIPDERKAWSSVASAVVVDRSGRCG